MAMNPKANAEKMNRMISAWRTLASNKSFGGMTLAEFEAFVNESLNARLSVAAAEDACMQAITDRDNFDAVFLQKAQLVVNGVLADPSEGENSAIYEAMGYIRRADRRSGLTRKKVEPVKS